MCRLLNRGNPAALPARWPLRDVDHFATARAALTDAHSNTSVTPRHLASPRQPADLVAILVESEDGNGGAAILPGVHVLMNDTFDHDNGAVRSLSATP